MDLKRLGQQLRDLRKSLGLTHETLHLASIEAEAKVAKNSIGPIEKGEANPEVGTLINMAKTLGTTLNFYLADTPEAKLITLFGRLNPDSRRRAISYMEGLIDAHQGELGSSGKRRNQ